jgi:hypothetical protein
MKRASKSNQSKIAALPQLTLDKNGALANSEEELTDFIDAITPTLSIEALTVLYKKVSSEVILRTSAACAMIPNDVWWSVFRFLSAHKDDAEVDFRLFPLRLVCTGWRDCLVRSYTIANVLSNNAINSIVALPNLRSLNLKAPTSIPYEIFRRSLPLLASMCFNPDATYFPKQAVWSKLTNLNTLELHCPSNPRDQLNFRLSYTSRGWDSSPLDIENLKLLVHLQKLDLGNLCGQRKSQFESKFGPNLQLLDYLKELKEVMVRKYDFLDINKIQQKYPQVQFHWGDKEAAVPEREERRRLLLGELGRERGNL